MSNSVTLTQVRAAFDQRAWTTVEVLNPAIALISRGPCLGILLARDMVIEPGGTLLRSVHWIRLPLGWRLTLARALSRIRTIRLPDEWLFPDVFLTLSCNGTFVARLDRQAPHALVLPSPSEFPYPVQSLSAGQYHRLSKAPGRFLEAQVRTLFRAHLGMDGERAADTIPLTLPGGSRPWTVFGK